jgi:hypothetical protein
MGNQPCGGAALGSIHTISQMCPVEIVETALEHEAVTLRFAVFLATARDRRFDDLVDLGLAVERKADQYLGGLAGVGDRLAGESLEEIVRQKHDRDAVANDHAGGLAVREIGIE